ncbi:MAG: hypothetical protein QNJ63_21455 [Calothrix sp. MO_192.B10]|nr:hypothetical protein [Calothrix sp. MO_192.B10]
MNPFTPVPPKWTQKAIHAHEFCCPQCKSSSLEAVEVWINRTSPVMMEDYRRKWQEFYQCHCGYAWWGWSSDRQIYPMEKTGNSPDFGLGI